MIINKLRDNELAIDKPDLPDYNIFFLDVDVEVLIIGTERETGDVKFDYYDADFILLDLI